MENLKNAFKETPDLGQDLSLFSSQWIDNKNISEKRRRIYSSKYHMGVIKEGHPINKLLSVYPGVTIEISCYQ